MARGSPPAPVACPACDAAVAVAEVDDSLLTCAACQVRFLAPGAERATLFTAHGDGLEQVAGRVTLSESFRARYELGRLLGVGGFGSVYQAKEKSSGDRVAIKFLWRVGLDEVLARFLREGRLLARLAHPNLIQVRHVEELEQHPFIVCEYVPGGTLKERLARQGRLTAPEAVKFGLDVLSGLAACHAAGVVHRDVKPGNVLLDARGHAKLADLGIAHIRDGEQELTAHGALLGTPAYMAPEVLGGERAGPAADLYATAVMLYELIAGTPPYVETNVALLVARIEAGRPPPLMERAPDCPPELARMIHAGLASDPAERPASAEQWADDLRRWRRTTLWGRDASAAGVSGQVSIAPPAAASRGLALGAGAAIALILIAGFSGGRQPAPPVVATPRPSATPAPSPAGPALPVDEAATFAPRPAAAWSRPAPHHRSAIRALGGTAPGELGVVDRDGLFARYALTDGAPRGGVNERAGEVMGAAADLSTVAWRTSAGVLKVGPPGQAARAFAVPLAEDETRYVAFSGDGRRVARATADGSLSIFETSNGLAVARPAVGARVQAIALNQDGAVLAVLLESGILELRREADGWRAQRMETTGGERVSLAPNAGALALLSLSRLELYVGQKRVREVKLEYPSGVAWAPSGKRLVVASLKAVQVVSLESTAVAELPWPGPDACQTVAWLAGDTVAGGGSKGTLAVWDEAARVRLWTRQRGARKVTGLACDRAGERVVLLGDDGLVRVIAEPDGRTVASLADGAGRELALAGAFALSRGPRGATLHELSTGRARPLVADRWCQAALPAPDALLVGSAGSVVRTDLTRNVSATFTLPGGLIGPGCFLDGRRAVVVPVSGKPFVHALDGARGAELDCSVRWDSEALDLDRRLVPSLDGTRLMVRAPASIEVLDTGTGARVARLPVPAATAAVALSPAGRRVAFATPSTLSIVDLATSRVLARWDPAAGLDPRMIGTPGASLAFSPSGLHLYAGTSEGQVVRFDLGGSAR